MKKRNENNSGLVYSTEHGRMCPVCGNPSGKCTCRSKKTVSPGSDGIIRVSRSTKGRKGKSVTLVTGILLPHDELAKLAKKLKQKCGSGGTVKSGVIEIQGDHRQVLVDDLKKQGYTVKLSGG